MSGTAAVDHSSRFLRFFMVGDSLVHGGHGDAGGTSGSWLHPGYHLTGRRSKPHTLQRQSDSLACALNALMCSLSLRTFAMSSGATGTNALCSSVKSPTGDDDAQPLSGETTSP